MPASVPAQSIRKSAKYRQEILWSGPFAYCSDPSPTLVDHVIPKSRGGTDERSNLAPACRPCNMEKLDVTPEEWKEWRLAKGFGWPPKSTARRILDLYYEFKAEREAQGKTVPSIAKLIDGIGGPL